MPTPSNENRIREWKKIKKELEYVATYANVENRERLLQFLVGQFQILEQLYLSSIVEALEKENQEHISSCEHAMTIRSAFGKKVICSRHCHKFESFDRAIEVVKSFTSKEK